MYHLLVTSSTAKNPSTSRLPPPPHINFLKMNLNKNKKIRVLPILSVFHFMILLLRWKMPHYLSLSCGPPLETFPRAPMPCGIYSCITQTGVVFFFEGKVISSSYSAPDPRAPSDTFIAAVNRGHTDGRRRFPVWKSQWKGCVGKVKIDITVPDNGYAGHVSTSVYY